MVTVAGRPPKRSSAAIAEGTVLIRVTAALAGRAGSARASATTTTVPPRASGRNSSKTERSKVIEVEARTPASSAGVNVSPAQRSSATALRWVIATPFGRPVEPEV